jgi:hypothetical protein
MESKLKQAEKVNKLRKQNAWKLSRKDPLEVGDICTRSTEGLKKVYFPRLPVMMTDIHAIWANTVYIVASKYGYLREMWTWNDVVHQKNYTAEILWLDTTRVDLREACPSKMHTMS